MKIVCTGKSLYNGTSGVAGGAVMVLVQFSQGPHQFNLLMFANDADQYRLGEEYTLTIGQPSGNVQA